MRLPVLLRRPPPCRPRHRLPARSRGLAQALADPRLSTRNRGLAPPAPIRAGNRKRRSRPRRPRYHPLPGRILAAFDRKHLRLFVRRFLRTLRNEGNSETVTAVTSGLFPSERRSLARMPGVEVIVAPNDGHPARQRLRDFQQAVASWPADTPVAYWDAADVVFQDRIAPLWDLVRAHPDQLLAVTEVIPFRESTTCWMWTETIRDPEARARALDLFRGCRTINSGFAAGTARTMLSYLKEADRLLNSPALQGTGDWGDQTAMNLYCRSNPHAWLEIPSGWNYCLIGLGPGALPGEPRRAHRAPRRRATSRGPRCGHDSEALGPGPSHGLNSRPVMRPECTRRPPRPPGKRWPSSLIG